MKVTIQHIGGHVTVANFDSESALELVSQLDTAQPDEFLQFELDGGKASTWIQKRNITRVDLDD